MAAANQIELQRRWHIGVGGEVTAYEKGVNDPVEKRNRNGVRDLWWMPWGKYRGKGFKAIHQQNPGYLAYMLDKGYLKDSNGNLKRNVITFLSKVCSSSPEWAQARIRSALEKQAA